MTAGAVKGEDSDISLMTVAGLRTMNALDRSVRLGDPNDDGQVSLTDAIHVLSFLFLGGVEPACMEAANVDDDDKVGITDGIFLLEYLFITGIAPLPPGPVDSPCAMDPAVSPVNLGCESYTHC